MMNKTYKRLMTPVGRAVVALVFALLCGLGSHAVGQDSSPERKQNIRRLLEITKAIELGKQAGEQILAQLKNNLTKLPPETRERIMTVVEEEVRKELSAEMMIDSITPIYERYLSDEDVKALIVFYESPLGQKVVTVMPQIMRESLENGTVRGREAGVRAIERLQAEGILPSSQEPKPDPKPTSKGGTRRARRTH